MHRKFPIGFLNTTQATNRQVNILLVDQSLNNLELLAAIVQKQNCQAHCVNSGVEAIKIARSGWAEMILLDVQLSDFDSFQLCQELKADSQTKEIPLIFTGAADSFIAQKKAFEVGGVDYLNKPFQIDEVVIKLRQQIAMQASQHEIRQLKKQLKQEAEQYLARLAQSQQQLQSEINRRQQIQDKLINTSTKDPITGFGNRNSLINRLKQALKITKQQPNYYFALILLECDRFKNIKRTISHIDSNQLLMAVAQTVANCLPESALLNRLEGEEFGIFLDNIQAENEAIAIVEKIQHQLTQPFVIKRRQILVNVNIGIAFGNQDYQDLDRLFNDADIAMQQAKQTGDRYQIFKPEMYIQLQEDTELANQEIELKQAISNQEFVNYYLPIVCLKTQHPVELEALVRWHHPQKGVVLPQDFIVFAEQMGLMNAIGNLVLRQGCHHLKYWQINHHQQDLGICINLSAKQLFHPSLVPKVDLVLRKTQIQGHHLKFDIAETVMIEQPKTALKILRELKKRQVRLCLDNFGAGYSSLTCLHRFPFDELKIDRSLMAHIGQKNLNLAEETSAALLLKQIITIAHQMKMSVTATGIENNYQLNLLKDTGCDRGQGYLISKLLHRDSVDHFLLFPGNS
ncbi:MAG: EAL domain-containing protein [Pleurocapsa sp.]